MISYKTLENTAIETLHETFVNAFSDYQVKMDLPLWKFQNMLERRGFIPEISLGAFKEDVLAGIILNGLRTWNGRPAVYDLGTGVMPEYRKQGITSCMLTNIKKILKERNIEQYLLEVIQTNTSAFNLYRKQGFSIVRGLDCFRLDKGSFSSTVTYETEHISSIEDSIWEELKNFWDFIPSWQNSIDSINAVKDLFIYSIVKFEGKIVGYGIIDRKSGDLVQLAVHKAHRHKGIGRSIAADLINSTEAKAAAALNIDHASTAVISFLHSLGFEGSVNQYEMLLEIR
ncbi:MAG: acetyltransferase, family, partial [Eubacterium sp.]|nr:acetyltransferase, family [Eubacterium sp.]